MTPAAPRPPGRWRGLVLGLVVAALAIAIMAWGISGSGTRSEDAIVTTCTAELQRCRLGGPKLGLCAALPDGSLECQSQH